jgi:TPR repeat protein
MKTTLLLLAAAFSLSFLSTNLSAQYSARNLTRKIVPPPGAPGTAPNQQQKATPPPTPAPVTPPAPVPAQTPAVKRPTPVPVVAARPVDPEKERAAQEKADQKAVEFEKQRANQDYGWAQYALGVRYMTGKGIDKDPDQARKWLEKAAKNGESQAVKKLAELNKEQIDTTKISTASDKPDDIGTAEKPVSAEQTGSDLKAEKK